MFKSLLVTAVTIGFSSAVFAASGGEAGSLFSLSMLAKTINFLILVALLWKFAKPPITKMLHSSAVNAKRDMDDAKTELAEAKKKLEDYKAKLANLESELEERRKNALAAIAAEKAQMLEDAEKQVQKMEQLSKEKIEADLLKAKNEIREFLVNESIKLAQDTISKEIGGKDQKALFENYAKFIKESA